MPKIAYTITLESPAILDLSGISNRQAHEGRLIIHGSAIRGLIRAHLSRLAKTGLAKEDMMVRVLGDLDHPSVFHISDAIAQVEDQPLWTTTICSIDRYTRGAGNDKSWQYEVIPPGTRFSGQIDLDVPPGSPEDSLIRMVLSSIRTVGFGRARGYGDCSITVAEVDTQ